MILAHDTATGEGLPHGKQNWGPIQSGEVWWILAEPLGENGAVEMQTFELFATRKDVSETQKVFEFGAECRPVPVEIKILNESPA